MTKPSNEVSVFVALDFSGSMSGTRWSGAVELLNSYVKNLRESGATGDISVVTFNSDSFPYNGPLNAGARTPKSQNIKTIADRMSIQAIKKFDFEHLVPVGSTPLYDAVGTVISMAEARNSEKTIVVILTDGEENCSVEFNLKTINNKIEAIKSRGWEVEFLGANFDSAGYASKVGLTRNMTMDNYDMTDVNAVMTASLAMSTRTMNYVTQTASQVGSSN